MTLLNVNSGFNYEGKECFDCRQDGCPECNEWCIYGSVPQSLTVTVQAVLPPAGWLVQNTSHFSFPACVTGNAQAWVPNLQCCQIDCQTDLNGTYNLPLSSSGGSSGYWCAASWKTVYIFCDGTIQVGNQGLISQPHGNHAKIDPVTGVKVATRAEISASLAAQTLGFPVQHKFILWLNVFGNPLAWNTSTNTQSYGCTAANFHDTWWQKYEKYFPVYPVFPPPAGTQPVLQDCHDFSGGTHLSGIGTYYWSHNSPTRFFNITVT